jgi:hypothetical protein
VSKFVILRPETKQYRNLIREYGSRWLMVKRAAMQCFGGKTGVLIASRDGKHSRWVLPSEIESILRPNLVDQT